MNDKIKTNNETSGSEVQVAAGNNVPSEGILQIAWKWRRLVLCVIATFFLIGTAYVCFAPNQYTSTSTIYVTQNGPKIIADDERVVKQSKNYLQTQCELIKSMPIISAALNMPGMNQLATFEGVDNRIAYLKENLEAQAGKNDDIIRVSFESHYPEEAARIVNTIVNAYVAYHSREKRSTAAEVLKILRNEKAELETELDGKLQAMMTFRQENDALSFEDGSGNIVIRRLAKLCEAFTDVQLETIEAKAANAAAVAIVDKKESGPYAIDIRQSDTVLAGFVDEEARINSMINQLRLELVELKNENTSEHPAVQLLESKITELNRQLEEKSTMFAENYHAFTNQKLKVAETKAQEIQRLFEQQRELAENLNNKAVQYAMLQTEWSRTENLCNVLDSRIKELNVTEEAGGLNISIVEPAIAEEIPSSPKTARAMVLAIGLGLMFGVISAITRNQVSIKLPKPKFEFLYAISRLIGKLKWNRKQRYVSENNSLFYQIPSKDNVIKRIWTRIANLPTHLINRLKMIANWVLSKVVTTKRQFITKLKGLRHFSARTLNNVTNRLWTRITNLSTHLITNLKMIANWALSKVVAVKKQFITKLKGLRHFAAKTLNVVTGLRFKFRPGRNRRVEDQENTEAIAKFYEDQNDNTGSRNAA